MNFCVFCSSSQEVDRIYFEEAEQLGKLIAMHHHHLVYGGANVGLMGKLANTALQHHAKVTGIMPQKLVDRERANKNCSKFITTKNMYDRKRKMAELADVFIALPGGFGTLEELFEIMTLKQLDYHDKAIFIINTNNYYAPLITLINSVVQTNFAQKSFTKLYRLVNSSEEVFEHIVN